LACRSALLLDALVRLGLTTAEEAAAGTLTLRLPSSGLGPQASRTCFASLRTISPQRGLRSSGRGRSMSSGSRLKASSGCCFRCPRTKVPVISIGDSLHFLSESCKLALERPCDDVRRAHVALVGQECSSGSPVTAAGSQSGRYSRVVGPLRCAS
jgi:hypothetical protein